MAEDVIPVFDAVAADYDNVGVDFFTPLGRELVRRAALKPGEHVLDLGCGRGAVLLPAAAAVGPDGHVTGTDLAPAMVALTAAAAAGLPQVTVRAGDAQHPGFPPASFDAITAGLVLFFLPDPPAAVAGYRELLRPSGRLAFSSFATFDPRYTATMKLLAGHLPDPTPPPARAPLFGSADALTEGLTAAGYQSVTTTAYAVESRFRNTAHLLRWIGSHGGRPVVAGIPAGRWDSVHAELPAVLGPPDQPLLLTTSVRYTVAYV